MAKTLYTLTLNFQVTDERWATLTDADLSLNVELLQEICIPDMVREQLRDLDFTHIILQEVD